MFGPTVSFLHKQSRSRVLSDKYAVFVLNMVSLDVGGLAPRISVVQAPLGFNNVHL